MTDSLTAGEALVRLLESYDVDTVFGIPGVHTLGLYRGLAASRIRHVTPRHEQGAGFMADGAARVTGRPGVAFVITGPGLTNIATPLAQAMSDSAPVLVVSSVAARRDLGMDRLRLHEITVQGAVAAPLVGWRHTLLDADELPRVLSRAFAGFAAGRPRPVHLELPLDVIDSPCAAPLRRAPAPSRPGADPRAIARMAACLRDSQRPLLILGGGCADAAAEARRLAARLDAPVLMTTAGAGVLPADDPRAIGMGLSAAAGLAAVAEADVVLAVGTDMSETNHWRDRLPVDGTLLRIDIDATSLPGDEADGIFVHADAALALGALHDALGTRERGGAVRAQQARAAILQEMAAEKPAHVRLLQAIRDGLPRDARLVTDMTQIAYTANSVFPVMVPRGLLHPSGYGTLGFALPAAIGASLALPGTPVACLIGDGGLQFTLPELAVAAEHGLPLPILLYDNGGYGQIRDDMRARGFQEIGVTFRNPDFAGIAAAYRCLYHAPENLSALRDALGAALHADRPTILHISDAIA